MTKTNAMRLLTAAGISFEAFAYEYDENDLSGVHTARYLGIGNDDFYKTLVLKGAKKGYLVCCIPVDRELDLKKAAAVFGDKSVEMLHVKDLLGVTGYIRGGCSPIGMKKKFPTFFEAAVLQKEKIYLSGGARGCALKVNVQELLRYTEAQPAELIK